MTRLLLAAAALVAVLAAAGVGAGAEWAVYPGAGTPIQTAINGAGEGDTIYVHAGTYVENVNVWKQLTLIGDGADVVTVRAASVYDDTVFEVTADYVTISGFTVEGEGGWSGMIYLDSVDHCKISNNVIFLNNTWGYGIYLYSSSNNNITNNNELYGNYRLYISNSCNNTITNNNNASINFFKSFNNTLASNDGISIWISCSSNNILKNNRMHSFGLDINPSNISEFINFVDMSNKVNGKPICYWIDEKDKEVPSDAGYVALVNCTNVTVRDTTITGNGQGIVLAYTKNSKIKNANASNNWDFGIGLYYSSNNEILNSNTSNEGGGYGGIFLRNSTYNTVTNNIASSNDRGIYLYYSSNNTLTNNIVNSNNRYGIYLWSSSNNTLSSNTANSNNEEDGICLEWSSKNTLQSNTANSNSDRGIGLFGSDNNTLQDNIVSNNWCGIYMWSSSNNTIYHNNLLDNGWHNAYDTGTNQWDSGSAGNYYSDYNGTDPDGDGIGEYPYHILGGGTSIDRYPLMHPWADTPSQKGDLNHDNHIAPADAVIALRIAVSGAHDDAADVSGDGRVTSLDALMILQAAGGAIII